MAAFSLAVALGVDGVEMDVQLAADGRPVVVHDASVTRTTDGAGMVHRLTTEQLAQLDATVSFRRRLLLRPRVRTAVHRTHHSVCPSGFDYDRQSIPTLEAVLDFLQASPLRRLYVELKGHKRNRLLLLRATIGLVREFQMEDRVTLISFDHSLLEWARTLAPGVKIAPIFTVGRTSLLTLASIRRGVVPAPEEVALHFGLATRRAVSDLHRRGARISVWTPNRRIVMRRMIAWGVDSIITDYPDRLAGLLDVRMPGQSE
jgi:glycerophosphoryl diester phosphodiesterase